MTNSITFYDLIRLLDLEQEVSVLIDEAEVYSGPLEEMSAGQMLIMERDEVEEIGADKLVINLTRATL